MKIFILMLSLLTLLGCSKNDTPIQVNTPGTEIIYGTRVRILTGFYKGQEGTVDKAWGDISDGCNEEYRVDLDGSAPDINICPEFFEKL